MSSSKRRLWWLAWKRNDIFLHLQAKKSSVNIRYTILLLHTGHWIDSATAMKNAFDVIKIDVKCKRSVMKTMTNKYFQTSNSKRAMSVLLVCGFGLAWKLSKPSQKRISHYITVLRMRITPASFVQSNLSVLRLCRVALIIFTEI